MENINREKDRPLYKQVKEIIKKKIEKGEYKPDIRLPSIVEFVRIFKVSTITVRQALTELIKEGYLETNGSKGTFVSKNWNEKKQKNNKLIGAIFTEFFRNPFFSEILAGIEFVMSSNGYHIIINNSDNNSEKEVRIIQEMMEKGTDGIILCPSSVNRSFIADQILKNLLDKKFPLVFVDRKVEDFPFDYVTTDNLNGGWTATKYLLGLGHKKIGLILGVGANTTMERLKGYQKALDENRIAFDPLMVKRSYTELAYEESGYQNTMELLNLKDPPTAIFALTDSIAWGSYRACGSLGIKIPEDLSIVGYDNLPASFSLVPPLTTMDQPKREMGEQAGELLLERIRGSSQPAKEIILKSNLIERGSCKKINIKIKKIPVGGGEKI